MPRTARKAGDGPRRLTKTEIAILAYVGEHEGEGCADDDIGCYYSESAFFHTLNYVCARAYM